MRTTLLMLLTSLAIMASPIWAVTFDAAVEYAAGNGAHGICTADLDGDGDLDIAVTNIDDDNLSIFKGNGDGTFAAAIPVALEAISQPRFVCAANLDGDDDIDLAVPYNGSGRMMILENDGDANFDVSGFYISEAFDFGICSGDLNNDGDQDLVIADDYNNGISVFANNGDATFSSMTTYPVCDRPMSVCPAYIDSDGYLDLAIACESGSVAILTNAGDGTFGDATHYSVTMQPGAVCAGDFDDDGHPDLGVALNIQEMATLKNNGDGTFASPVHYTTSTWGSAIIAADLDNDGDCDLAQANNFSNDIIIFTNDGDGNFTNDGAISCGGTGTWNLTHGDFNNDGKIDLAVSTYETDNIWVFLNTTVITGVEDSHGPDDLPGQIGLRQNYPNPFNATTSIEFYLPQPMNVEMTICNISGQAVRHLLNEELPAGVHVIQWDSCNDYGQSVATGIYLCHFRAGDYVGTRKMALLK